MMKRKNKVRSASGISSVSSDEDTADTSSSPSKPSPAQLLRKHSDENAVNRNGGGAIPSAAASTPPPKNKIMIATVKRNTWGTQPFDKHWLNLDCCGLICAALTYLLHAYGVYAFGWVLLPPWFSVMDEDGYREYTFGFNFHRTLFITIAILAVFAHFKAMTTDPGAVPPDANPLPDLEELESLIKGEDSPSINASKNKKMGGGGGVEHSYEKNLNTTTATSSLMQEETAQQNQEHQSLLSSKNGGQSQEMKTVVASSFATAPATATLGAAAIVVGGVAGAVATVAASAAPQKPPDYHHQHDHDCNHNTPSTPSTALTPRGRRMCRRCQAFKPPRAHHCSICKRCIIKMDHHCPWVNNCVGIGNHKYFLLFIFYTSLSCGYSLAFLIWRFCHCLGGAGSSGSGSNHYRPGPSCVDHPSDLLPLIGLTVEALLFGMFTLCMMCDQWDVVMTNLTHIDRLKGHHHDNTLHYRVQAGINEVFGTGRPTTPSSLLPHHATNFRRGFHYTWLSPLHKVCFPESIRDDIFGYCRPVGSSRGGGRGGQPNGIAISGLSGGCAEIV